MVSSLLSFTTASMGSPNWKDLFGADSAAAGEFPTLNFACPTDPSDPSTLPLTLQVKAVSNFSVGQLSTRTVTHSPASTPSVAGGFSRTLDAFCR